jgi:hypothetical protein
MKRLAAWLRNWWTAPSYTNSKGPEGGDSVPWTLFGSRGRFPRHPGGPL